MRQEAVCRVQVRLAGPRVAYNPVTAYRRYTWLPHPVITYVVIIGKGRLCVNQEGVGHGNALTLKGSVITLKRFVPA